MAAATVAFTKIATEPFRLIGGMRVRIVTLTMVASTSTYTDGGIADTTNFTSTWHLKLDMRRIKYVLPMSPLRSSDFELVLPKFEVDTTNRKIVLSRAGGTSITGTGIAIASATSITDSGNGFVTAGFAAGDVIHVAGFATQDANGTAIVSTVAAGTLTILADHLVAEAAGNSVTITKIGGQTDSEMVNGSAIPDGTYTATCLVIGD